MAAGPGTTIYDQLPYPPLSYVHTHPDRLATIAYLLGLDPPSFDRCRVLEVGSAIGGNLIPMALQAPGSDFTGVDLSPGQVASANAMAERLSLENVRFEQRDIRDFDDDLEPFDFIIAHGFYSWVPPSARDALLEACARRLTPNGIAYVSYNAYPGWHGLEAIRGIMQLAASGVDDPLEQARAGVEAVHFLRRVNPENHPLAGFLDWYIEVEQSRLDLGSERSATLLLHDELSDVNDPCYFHEFVDHARRIGLDYLADADLPTSFPNNVPPEVVREISSRVRTAVEFEQYLDFLRNNTFRRSLLVRDTGDVRRQMQPDPARMRRLFVRSQARPGDGDAVDLSDRSVVSFVTTGGARLAMDHPLSKAAMLVLREAAPAALPFDELVARAGTLLDASAPAAEDDIVVLCANLLRGYTYSVDLVELRMSRPEIVTSPSPRPVADAYARALASSGETVVTNRYHERIRLYPAHAATLSLLDGTRDLDALAAGVTKMVAPREGGEKAPEPREIVDESLRFFGAAALLVR